jgi:hypothetical protein
MEKFPSLTRCPGTRRTALRLVIRAYLVLFDENAGVSLPALPDFPTMFQPLLQRAQHR